MAWLRILAIMAPRARRGAEAPVSEVLVVATTGFLSLRGRARGLASRRRICCRVSISRDRRKYGTTRLRSVPPARAPGARLHSCTLPRIWDAMLSGAEVFHPRAGRVGRLGERPACKVRTTPRPALTRDAMSGGLDLGPEAGTPPTWPRQGACRHRIVRRSRRTASRGEAQRMPHSFRSFQQQSRQPRCGQFCRRSARTRAVRIPGTLYESPLPRAFARQAASDRHRLAVKTALLARSCRAEPVLAQ